MRDLANAFAAFRWGGLLKAHDCSAHGVPATRSLALPTITWACAGPGSPPPGLATGRAAGSAGRSGPCPSCSASTTRRPCSERPPSCPDSSLPGKKVDRVVRIVLALLSLLTAHGPGRAVLAGPGGGAPQSGSAGASCCPAAGCRRRPRRTGHRSRPATRPHRRPGRHGPATAAAAQADHRGHGARSRRAHLPQGHRVRGPGRAVRRPAPGRPQRAPAQRAVRLAVAGRHRGDHDQHRSRPLGAAEDRGDLPARPGAGELRFLLHPHGLQEHRPVALLVRQHLLRGRARVRHRGPQPRPGLVEARRRGTTASTC